MDCFKQRDLVHDNDIEAAKKAIEKYWIEYAHFCDKQFE